MFSSILLQGECCTFKDGEYVKSGLAELEGWCTEATKEVHCIPPFYNFPMHTEVSYILQTVIEECVQKRQRVCSRTLILM